MCRSREAASHLSRSKTAHRSGNFRLIHLLQTACCRSSMSHAVRMLPWTSIIPGRHEPRFFSASSVMLVSSPGGATICQCLPSSRRHSCGPAAAGMVNGTVNGACASAGAAIALSARGGAGVRGTSRASTSATEVDAVGRVQAANRRTAAARGRPGRACASRRPRCGTPRGSPGPGESALWNHRQHRRLRVARARR